MYHKLIRFTVSMMFICYRFKLLGELPLLHVKVSEQKIKGMFNLLTSIPLPSTEDPLTPTKKVCASMRKSMSFMSKRGCALA